MYPFSFALEAVQGSLYCGQRLWTITAVHKRGSRWEVVAENKSLQWQNSWPRSFCWFWTPTKTWRDVPGTALKCPETETPPTECGILWLNSCTFIHKKKVCVKTWPLAWRSLCPAPGNSSAARTESQSLHAINCHLLRSLWHKERSNHSFPHSAHNPTLADATPWEMGRSCCLGRETHYGLATPFLLIARYASSGRPKWIFHNDTVRMCPARPTTLLQLRIVTQDLWFKVMNQKSKK